VRLLIEKVSLLCIAASKVNQARFGIAVSKCIHKSFKVHIKTTLDIYLKAGLLIIGVLAFYQKHYKSLFLPYLLVLGMG
jgi:hypothetical protein